MAERTKVRERRGQHEVDLSKSELAPVVGRRTKAEAIAPVAGAESFEQALNVIMQSLPRLADANERGDATASGELAGLVHASLTHAEAASETLRDPAVSARLVAIMQVVAPLLTDAFAPSDAALVEAMHWGGAKREQWNVDVDAWKAHRAVASANENLPHLAEIQRAFGKHDVSDVRVQVGGKAGGAARDRTAHAFASGSRIAFASAPDLHTAAHEAAHVIQQRTGGSGDFEAHADAVADLVVQGQSAEGLLDSVRGAGSVPRVQLKSTSAAPAKTDIAEYVGANVVHIMAAVADRVRELGLPRPHKRLGWTSLEGAATSVVLAIRDYVIVRGTPGHALELFQSLVAPTNLQARIAGAMQGPGGRDAVALAVATAFDRPIAESVARMGQRLRAYVDKTNVFDSTKLVPTTSLDAVIAQAMMKNVTGNFLKKGEKAEKSPLTDGAPEVNVEYLGKKSPELWNWIKVDPPNATVEQVATTGMAGDKHDRALGTTQAYRIIASAPFFGLPADFAKDIEEVKHLADRGAGSLAMSDVADAAALAQMPKADKTTQPIDSSMGDIQLALDSLQADLAGWRAARPLTAPRSFFERRQKELRKDRVHAAKWTPALDAEAKVLKTIANEVHELAAGNTYETAGAALKQTIIAYSAAAGVAHLPANARDALAEAHRQRSEISLGDMDEQLESSRNNIADPSDAVALAKRAADLRATVERGGKGSELDNATLVADSNELALRNGFAKIIGKLDELEKSADAVGITQNEFEGGSPTLRANTHAMRKKCQSALASLDSSAKWKGPTSGNTADETILSQRQSAIASAAAVATSLQGSKSELQQHLQWADKIIANKRISNLINHLLVEVALMVVTGQFARAAVSAVRGVVLGVEIANEVRTAGLGIELTTTLLQASLMSGAHAMMGDKVTAKDFAENMIAMSAMTVMLRPFEGLLGNDAEIVADLRTITQKAATKATRVALEAGATYTSSVVAHALTTSGEMYTMTGGDVVEQGFTMLLGHLVHKRLEAMGAHIETASEKLGKEALDPIRKEYEQQRQTTKEPPKTKEEAKTRFQALVRLKAKLRDLVKGRVELEKMLDQEKTPGAKFAAVPLGMGNLETVVEGRAYKGKQKDIDASLEDLKKSGVPVKEIAGPNESTKRIEVGTAPDVERIDLLVIDAKPHSPPPLDEEKLFGRKLTPKERSTVAKLVALDESKALALIEQYKTSILEYLRTQPVSDLETMANDLRRLAKKKTDRTPGHYNGIDLSKPPEGWEFNDHGGVKRGAGGKNTITTTVIGPPPDRAMGSFTRSYNPKTKRLDLEVAFMQVDGYDVELPNRVLKQGAAPEMVPSWGTPTIQYVTFYQMRKLGVPLGASDPGGVTSLHMSTIQNFETIVHLHWLKEHVGGTYGELVGFTASMDYGATTLVQSGYALDGHPKVSGGYESPIGDLMAIYEQDAPTKRDGHEAILRKYGYSRATVMYQNFNIDADVKPETKP